MSAVEFFNAARAYKRDLTGEAVVGLSQEDVNALNAATVARWHREPPGSSKGVADTGAFFAALRQAFGALQQPQVDGIQTILGAIGASASPIAFAAYELATAWHETNATMQPVVEAYWKSEAWRKVNLRYYPWHGRGYVQLTWEANYRKADEALGLDGKLLQDPSLALQPEIAAKVLVRGMVEGWFTSKRLADYLPSVGTANLQQFHEARRIINGLDKADLIAGYAARFQSALVAGAWA